MTIADRPKLHLKFASKPEIEAAIATYAPPPPAAPPPAAATPPKHRLSSAERQDRVIARLEALRQAWPAAFRPCDDPGPWPQLATGIHKAIRDRDPELGRPRILLGSAVARYMNDHRYRAGLIAGAVCIDLDGAPPATQPKPRLSSGHWLDLIIARLEALRQTWPRTFRPCDDPGPWPPLAINIHRSIRQRDPALGRPYGLLRAALARYANDHRYRAGRIAGAVRVDLDGAPAGLCDGTPPLPREGRASIMAQQIKETQMTRENNLVQRQGRHSIVK
jgi:sRNA-binding protein